MTARQKELLTFIRDYVDSKGISPTVQEMSEALGRVSKSNAHAILHRLVGAGYLVRRPSKQRSYWPATPVFEGLFDLSAIPTSALRNELVRRGEGR